MALFLCLLGHRCHPPPRPFANPRNLRTTRPRRHHRPRPSTCSVSNGGGHHPSSGADICQHGGRRSSTRRSRQASTFASLHCSRRGRNPMCPRPVSSPSHCPSCTKPASGLPILTTPPTRLPLLPALSWVYTSCCAPASTWASLTISRITFSG